MEEFGIHVGPIPEPGEVVEGFDDTDETNSDLEDELVPLSIEVLILSCI
jgi:hypothetical protein